VADEQDGDLVAADAGHRVGGAHAAASACRDRLQHGVAGEVAVTVVGIPEAVDVHDRERNRLIPPRGVAQRLAEAVEEQAPVRKVGQAVVRRRMQQLVELARALGGVAPERDEMRDAPASNSGRMILSS
jgi:hypothetical protein